MREGVFYMPKNEGQSNREYCEAQGPSSGNDRTLSFTERQYYTILRKKNQTEEMVSKYSDIDGKIKDFQASIMSYGLRLGMSKGDFREKHIPVYKEALLAVKEFKDLQTHIEIKKNRGIKEYDWENAHITANACKHDVDRFFRKNVEETLLLIFDKGVEQYSNLKKSMLDQPGIQQSLEDVDGHFNSLCRHVKENMGKLDN